METKFNLYQIAIIIMVLIICGIIFVVYSLNFFSTFIGSSGLNGDMYSYYRLERWQFCLYTFLVTLSSVLLAFQFLIALFKKDKNKFKRSLIKFSILILLIIISEIYLSYRFVGKG